MTRDVVPAPPLRNRRFLTVVCGEGASMIGDAAFAVSLAWLVLAETGSVSTLTGVLLAQTIPRGALLLRGGSVTDRVSARTVMFVSHLARAVAMAGTAAVVLADAWSLGHLYARAIVMGVAGAFFTPASESVIPDLVGPTDYGRANAVQSTVEQVSFLVGPLLGGVLSTAYGGGPALLLNAATFVVAALTCRAVPPGTGGDSVGETGMVGHLAEGLRHAWRDHSIRLVLLVVSAATLSYAGLFAVGLPALGRFSRGDRADRPPGRRAGCSR